MRERMKMNKMYFGGKSKIVFLNMVEGFIK